MRKWCRHFLASSGNTLNNLSREENNVTRIAMWLFAVLGVLLFIMTSFWHLRSSFENGKTIINEPYLSCEEAFNAGINGYWNRTFDTDKKRCRVDFDKRLAAIPAPTCKVIGNSVRVNNTIYSLANITVTRDQQLLPYITDTPNHPL